MTFAALALLWVLATVDGAFIGYRDVAGRSAIIDKRRYFREAMRRGALWVQIPALLAAAAATALRSASEDPAAVGEAWGRAAAGMLAVYLPYAGGILATMAVGRVARTVDLRSAVHLVILGPFTMLRPAVVAAGAVAGYLAAPLPQVAAMELLIATMMLGLAPLLSLRHPDPWRLESR